MPPKLVSGGKHNSDLFGIRQFCADDKSSHSFVHRQNSIISYQNLSVGDCTSVTDSQFSHYNPSVNEPYVSDDADPAEKEMHRFLDSCGIFQINVK